MNKEYLFEEISLEECCREVLDEYRLYLEEKQILVQLDLKEKTVPVSYTHLTLPTTPYV